MTYKFYCAPADWDEMEFQAYAHTDGYCDCIEYKDDDGQWQDIEHPHWGLPIEIQKAVWSHYHTEREFYK